MPPQQTGLVKIEYLLGAVTRHRARKRHPQTSPRFAVFCPRLHFFALESGQSEEERRRQICPDRITAKISEVQAVPKGRAHMICDSRPGVVARLNYGAVVGHDCCPARFVNATLAGFAEWRILDMLPVQIEVNADVVQYTCFPFSRPQGSCYCFINSKMRELLPAIPAPMRGNR